MHFLDVGRGDSILLSDGEHVALIDTGPRDDITAKLKKVSVRRIASDVPRLLERPAPLIRRVMGNDCKVDLSIRPNTECTGIVDPVEFEQAVLNLVINARQAMGDDGGSLSVAVERSSEARVHVSQCRTTGRAYPWSFASASSSRSIRRDQLGPGWACPRRAPRTRGRR